MSDEAASAPGKIPYKKALSNRLLELQSDRRNVLLKARTRPVAYMAANDSQLLTRHFGPMGRERSWQYRGVTASERERHGALLRGHCTCFPRYLRIFSAHQFSAHQSRQQNHNQKYRGRLNTAMTAMLITTA